MKNTVIGTAGSFVAGEVLGGKWVWVPALRFGGTAGALRPTCRRCAGDSYKSPIGTESFSVHVIAA